MMHGDVQKKLIAYLEQFTTAHKVELIDSVLEKRTRHVTIALEDIFHGHNISAAVRSAEGFGVQDVHIIEQRHRYAFKNGIDKGASEWLSVQRFDNKAINNTQACFEYLKNNGYAVVVTSPHAQGYTLDTLPLDKKIALVFGTEQSGATQYALENADMHVRVPMYGFTESFNISVCAALCLYDITTRLRKSDVVWQLTEQEKAAIKLDWLRNIVRGADELEKLFLTQAEVLP
ncbi:MAG: RNA methyltransferase [Candidatus Babeliaceae bacterium]|jgi:tRNA (guanosine-2'-O-)-methyltransferase